MINGDRLERTLNFFVCVKSGFVYKVVQPLLVELSLYFAEHSFNRIELGAVAHIENRLDVKFVP